MTFIVGNRAKWIQRDKGVRNEGNRQTLLMQTEDFVVKGDKREWVQRDAHLTIKGDRREAVDDSRSFIVVEDHHEKIGGTHAIASGQSSSYHADQKLVGEGGASVSVKGPGGFLTIDGSGVTISGTLVRINAGGSPGSSMQAKPTEPVAAGELKQPAMPDVIVDLGALENISGYNKALAALGALATAKPTAGGMTWGSEVSFGGLSVFQQGDLIDPGAQDELGTTNLARMAAGVAPIAPDGNPVSLRPSPKGGPGALAESKGTFQKDFGALLRASPKTIPSAGERAKHAAWKRGYWRQRAAGFAPGGGAA